MSNTIARTQQEKDVLAHLLENISYEVMPFKSVRDKVLDHVPKDIPLNVTATGNKGLKPTVDISVSLRESGYSVAPHLPARTLSGPEELDEVVNRLRTADIDRIFVIGGDESEPRGDYTDALGLLEALHERGHHFSDIGIGGYPEGHALLPPQGIEQALADKAPYADRILTQICFDPKAIHTWAKAVRDNGTRLPISVGIPAPVSRQKLMRISASLGLGQSARFLTKQRSMFWKFFSPSGYSPARLIRGLVRSSPDDRSAIHDRQIHGLHIYTFNDLETTEAWRQNLLRETR